MGCAEIALGFYAGRFRFGGDLIKKLDFKSIVTFAVVGTLVIGVLVIIAGIPIGYIDAETAKSVIMSLSENFDRILMMIITFYFARKASEKKDGEA